MATKAKKKRSKAKPKLRQGRSKGRRWAGAPRFVCLVVILSLAGLTYAWSAYRVVQLGYRISRLETEQARAHDLNRKLRIELVSLRSPERIEKIAKTKLGLINPPADRVVILR